MWVIHILTLNISTSLVWNYRNVIFIFLPISLITPEGRSTQADRSPDGKQMRRKHCVYHEEAFIKLRNQNNHQKSHAPKFWKDHNKLKILSSLEKTSIKLRTQNYNSFAVIEIDDLTSKGSAQFYWKDKCKIFQNSNGARMDDNVSKMLRERKMQNT